MQHRQVRGSYCRARSATPIECAPATFSNVSALSLCSGCDAGEFQSSSGATACGACDAGGWCGAYASLVTLCDAGSYRGESGGVSQSDCLACPAGSWCAKGATAPSACAAGSITAASGGATCTACDVGEYQLSPGSTVCKACDAGGWCGAGVSSVTLCNAGSYRGTTRGTSQADCTPVPPGTWAPAGSTAPIVCTSNALYCPGALADELYGGGQPIILEEGASSQSVTTTQLVTTTRPEIVTETVTETRAVTETVSEEQETWSVTASITLEQNPETYNETAVRLELAALYGVPLSWIQLSATAGSLVLAVRIAPPPSALAASAAGGPVLVSAADVVSAVDAADASTLSQALNATASLAESASLAHENVTLVRNVTTQQNVSFAVNVTVERNVTTLVNVTSEVDISCPPGYACVAGVQRPCRPGSFANASRSTECTYCEAGSFQSAAGASACVGCEPGKFCPEGATRQLDPSCPSGTHRDQLDETGDPECFPCPPGHFCLGSSVPEQPCSLKSYAGPGEAVCTTCALQHSTTLAKAARSEDDCCCAEGFFLDVGADGQRECVSCNDKALRESDATACDAPGIELLTLPLRRGFCAPAAPRTRNPHSNPRTLPSFTRWSSQGASMASRRTSARARQRTPARVAPCARRTTQR